VNSRAIGRVEGWERSPCGPSMSALGMSVIQARTSSLRKSGAWRSLRRASMPFVSCGGGSSTPELAALAPPVTGVGRRARDSEQADGRIWADEVFIEAAPHSDLWRRTVRSTSRQPSANSSETTRPSASCHEESVRLSSMPCQSIPSTGFTCGWTTFVTAMFTLAMRTAGGHPHAEGWRRHVAQRPSSRLEGGRDAWPQQVPDRSQRGLEEDAGPASPWSPDGASLLESAGSVRDQGFRSS
jgi:hypothetical protein